MSDPLRALREMRDAIGAAPEPASPLLAAYLEKVRRRAVEVTDEDVAGLLASGLTQDQVYEATMRAAMTAGIERYEAGLRALEKARR